MNFARTAAAAIVLLGIAVGGGAIGTILVTNADIQVGDGSNDGTITIDPAFPLVAPPSIPSPDPLGSLGSITGPLPGFPGGGAGSDGVYNSGTGATTLSSGLHEYSSFTVQPGAVVTCDGGVTILVTGNVDISGTLTSNQNSASIVVYCGGDFTIAGGDFATTNNGISTSGTNALIEVIAAGDLRVGNPLDGNTAAYITTFSGPILVTGTGASSAFEIGNGIVECTDGILMARAAGSMSLTGSRTRVQSSVGVSVSEMRVQAFGGDLLVDGGALVQANNYVGDLLVEASGSLTVSGGATVRAQGNPSLRASAFGGPVAINGGTLQANSNGILEVRASTGVAFTNGAAVSSQDGPMIVVAHGGDLDLQLAGSPTNLVVSTYNGSMLLAASGDVAMGSNAYVTSFAGRTDVDAFGDFVMSGSGTMRLGSYNGDLEVVAAGAVVAAVDLSEGPNVVVRGGVVGIYAGSGGADLDDMEVDSESGDLDVIAFGPVVVHERLDAAGHLTVESASGNIDVSGAELVTRSNGSPNLVVQSLPPPPQDTGDVLVWCHLQNGTIDATDAFIRTGDSADTSGDIRLLVNGASQPVESFILPKKINARYDPEEPGKSRLASSGFLDTGPDAVDLAGPATVAVGDLDIEVPGFTPNASGTKFSFKSPGLVMSIIGSKVGSSRARFRLLATGAFTQSPDLEGNITLRFNSELAEGLGVVDLDAGKFTLGRKRGSLVEPNLHLFRAKAVLEGGGDDSVTIKVGLATNGITPEAAPDLHFGFGNYETDINGGTLVPSGDRFTFRGPGPGVTLVVLDYLKETITVQAKGVDLGEFAEGSSAIPIRIGLGGDQRIVTVRMGKKGKALIY